MEYRRLYIAYGSNINIEQMANRCLVNIFRRIRKRL